MAYQPRPPCDSYFVESHNERSRAVRDEMKKHEAYVKRQTQDNIAANLSEIAKQEYGAEILQYMEQMEVETLPDVASIDIQTEIQWFMRPYLLDFLVEAHSAFSLMPETLFLTINLLDRYCSKRIVYRRHFQLVGSAALLVAAKFGDRKERVPTIKELRSMCCGFYEDEMFTQMEWHVLETLGWNIGHPTIDDFLQAAMENTQYDLEIEHMACYISEMALYHKDFVSKRSSDMARASLALARCILNRPQSLSTDWAAQYESATLIALSQYLGRPSPVLSRKYSNSQLSRVAIKLEEFLEHQEMINRSMAAPPPPPVEKPSTHQTYCPVTPVKQQYLPSAPPGCLTPPDTPGGDVYYIDGQPSVLNCGPPTPQSMGSKYSRSQTHYQLPPIDRLPSMYSSM
ncbi:MAG: hypothetical protein Q9220_006511 [cf. Caloplaca sp. 1 TL-2023]